MLLFLKKYINKYTVTSHQKEFKIAVNFYSSFL